MEASEPAPSGGVDAASTAHSKWRRPLLIAGPLLATLAVVVLYVKSGRYESTDNASLRAAQVAIASNVSGKVVAIDVSENAVVRGGQVLFRINPEPYQAAVDEAEAQLAAVRTEIDSLRATYGQAHAEIDAAQARVTHAEAEAQRHKSLLAIGVSTQARYEEALLALRTTQETLKAARARSESVRASLAGSVDAPIDAHPTVRRARAALERARIALTDTTVLAPQEGIVTRVNQLQVGTYVSASRPVFVLMGRRVWVEANFKESQLRHMRQGQLASVAIDAYPDHPLKARVASFSPGTGNSFALLPAENATGNWVKVVQRLPVQLELEDVPHELPLHSGLSLEVTVDTGRRSYLAWQDSAAEPVTKRPIARSSP